ncbi:hypothetical protein PB70LOC_04472 [Pectobacterium versatile]|uniref:Uncharacterized protein n=1 Tax=Pectobacterium odoriferum TaxID=78398 RepID=A0ABR4VJ48_9GAMM|nr:hypothetical protein KU75_22775 [Pectobacterium odoriferum]POY54816.1 hypothetical protein PB70LOC_04472 [Pectobacterium versatile]POY60849.1 hypothetical protein PB69LOC_04472 [Pectobacterium versatile]
MYIKGLERLTKLDYFFLVLQDTPLCVIYRKTKGLPKRAFCFIKLSVIKTADHPMMYQMVGGAARYHQSLVEKPHIAGQAGIECIILMHTSQ